MNVRKVDDTACAERSLHAFGDPVFSACSACGHTSCPAPGEPCDACRLTVRIQALERLLP